MFNNREDWFIHESQHHSTFFCGISSHQHYDNLVSFRNHMTTTHSASVGYDGDMSTMEIFLRRAQRLDGHCNLCGQSTNHLKHHTGRHLERIALFALPRIHVTEDGVAERPEDTDISIGNFQGSKRDSSNPDGSVQVDSDTSSISIRNLGFDSRHINKDNTTPSLRDLINGCAGLRGSEGTLPRGFLLQLKNRIRVLLDDQERSLAYNDQFKNACSRFLKSINEPGRSKNELETDRRAENIVLAFFSFATREVNRGNSPTTQDAMRTINRHVSLFVVMLSQTLAYDGEMPALASNLSKLATDLLEDEENSNQPGSTSPSPNDVPDAAQEEHWNAIKPELGLPATIGPPSDGGFSDISSHSLPSDTRYRFDDSKSQDNKLYVLVLGSIGSGKTSFIDRCLGSGHALMGRTASITEYNMVFDGRATCLIDTPGFGDLVNDIDPFLSLSQWIYDFGASSVPLAIVICHRIGPFLSSHESHIKLYKSICGQECYRHIALVSTGWDIRHTSEDSSIDKHLIEQRRLWADFIQGGAITLSLSDNKGSARALLGLIGDPSTRIPIVGLQLQREIHRSRMSLSETSAGSEVISAIRESYNEIEELHARYAIGKAKEHQSPTQQESDVLERNKKTAVLEEHLQKLKLNEQALLSYDVRRQAGHKGILSSQTLAAGVGAAEKSQQTRPEDLDVIEQDTLMILPDGLEPNSLTVGLTEYMMDLESKLPRGTDSQWDYASVVIWGPPGIGKTHLAKEYMWRRKSEYPGGIFWIDCTSHEAAVKCFDNISKIAKVRRSGRNTIAAVREWFEGRRK
jgi:hypothetical protein